MKEVLLRYLAIGFAGSLGAIARYAVGSQIGRLNYRFPLGTLVINITGSIFLGWFAAHIVKHPVSNVTSLAIGTGFVGAYTTFSTFMYESNKLADGGAFFLAIMNIVVSLVLGILGVRLGIFLAK